MDDSILNVSEVSEVSDIFTSTPKSSKRRSAAQRPFTFKAPSKPKQRKNPICAICHICGKDYVRKKSFEDHMRMHFILDANSRYPDEAMLTSETPLIAQSCLEKMAKIQSIGQYGAEHKMFVRYILNFKDDIHWLKLSSAISQQFISALVKGKILLPSALLPAILKACDHILTDKEFRENEMMKNLRNVGDDCDDWSEAMLQCFLCEFVHKFGEEMLIFICRHVVGVTVRKPPAVPVELDIEDRQVIFYVAGSVMRGFLRMGFKHIKNKDWCSIVRAIRSRVLEGDGKTGVPRCAQSDRAWTETQNRKSLIFIGAPAMDFFVSLTHLLYNVECTEDGDFHISNVMKNVFEDSVTVLLWDEVIGTSLEPTLSTRFLQGAVKSYTQTYARGVASKKLNNHLKKAFAAINLRHSVAPRQSA